MELGHSNGPESPTTPATGLQTGRSEAERREANRLANQRFRDRQKKRQLACALGEPQSALFAERESFERSLTEMRRERDGAQDALKKQEQQNAKLMTRVLTVKRQLTKAQGTSKRLRSELDKAKSEVVSLMHDLPTPSHDCN